MEWRLFITLWLVYAVHATPAGGVTPNRYVDLVHAIVNEGRFEIDSYHENTVDKAFSNGHYYAGALPGPAILAVPPYLLFRALYPLVPPDLKEMASEASSFKKGTAPATGFYGQVDNVEFFLSQAFLVVFAVALASALSGVLFFRTLKSMNTDGRVAHLLTFTFAFGTILFWNSTVFFEQAFTVFFAIAAFYVLFRSLDKMPSGGALLGGGFLAGCALLVEMSALLLGLSLFVYGLLRTRRPLAMMYWVGFSMPALALALYDYALFGNPFLTPYQQLAGTEYQAIVEEGFVGVSYPHLDRLVGLLISPERGILVFAPITILGLAGLVIPSVSRMRFRQEAIFFSLIVVSTLLFVSSFKGWNAGGAFGPRYLILGLPFMVLPAGFLLTGSNVRIGVVVSAVSILINWSGAQYGFAQTYYDNLALMLTEGPTLPVVQAIVTHSVGSSWFPELVRTQGPWLSALILVGLLGVLLLVWWRPQPAHHRSDSQPWGGSTA